MKKFTKSIAQNIELADQLATEKGQGDIDAAKAAGAPTAATVAPVRATPQRAAYVAGKLSKDKSAGKFFQLDTSLNAVLENVIQSGATASSINYAIALGLAAAQAYRFKTGKTLEGDVNAENFGLNPEQMLELFEDKNIIPAINGLFYWADSNRKAPEKREKSEES